VRRETFEQLISELVDKATGCLVQALADAGISASHCNAVLLVGGCAGMPCFYDAIERRLGAQPIAAAEPLFATAKGAVAEARIALERQGRTLTVKGIALPPIERFTCDVLSRDFGITVESPDRRNLILEPVVARNQPLPSDITKRFKLAEDGQTSARIQVVEGNAGDSIGDCRIVGEFDLENMPPVHGKAHPVEIRLKLDSAGILEAIARDTIGGKSADLQLNYKTQTA